MGTTWQFDAKSFGIKEFLIDFFGSLMPGFVFMIVFVSSFVIFLYSTHGLFGLVDFKIAVADD
ncbi:MAG TPA: hypothetical protein VHR47_07230 [Bacillota bacterium]|nr:hypothetical protein [Bacillota bacterium]